MPRPVAGRTKSSATSDCQENHLPNKSLSPRQKLAPDPLANLIPNLHGVRTKEKGNAQGFVEEKSMLLESILSQSTLEIKKLEDNNDKGRAVTSFSLSDVSMLCSDIPDLHSTAILQDADISHLIDNVTLTNENEPGSSISALIGQFDETNPQANITVVSHLHSASMMSGCPPLPPMALKTPFKHGFSKGKPRAHFLCSSPELIASSSPETTKLATYTVVCEKTSTPISITKPNDDFSSKTKMRVMDGNLLTSPNCLHDWLPKSPTSGEDWGVLKRCSTAISTDSMLDNPTLCINSGESSLMEIEGESENLSLTAYEYRGDNTSQLASPLKLKYSQDVVEHCQRGLRNGYCKETLHPSIPEVFNNIQDVKTQSNSCLTYQGAGFVNNHFSNSDAKMNQICEPQQSSARDVHAPVLKQSTHPRLPALKLPSPCKSKSLGDLTSEDIACNFESKYQCISKSFVTTGIRDKKAVTVKTNSLEPLDALTEQLRKLVSFDQEDGCQVLYSKQDASQFPRALVRKLSSRSQSRVRNIASRAKEKQEASKQKVVNPSNGAGVVFRNRSSAPAPAVNRHSTGSYIAGYLRNGKAGSLEGRGIPEGACTALRYGYVDQFCSDNSVLQTEPNSDDKPEIYFLLRL